MTRGNGKSALLTRDQILAIADVPFEDVPMPEWKGVVRVQGMTVGQRNLWERSNTRSFKGRNGQMVTEVSEAALTTYRQRLVAQCLVDADGARLFSDADVALLEQKSAAAMERLVEVANRLNGVTKQDLKELEGNSEEATGGDEASSDSHPSSDAPSLN